MNLCMRCAKGVLGPDLFDEGLVAWRRGMVLVGLSAEVVKGEFGSFTASAKELIVADFVDCSIRRLWN